LSKKKKEGGGLQASTLRLGKFLKAQYEKTEQNVHAISKEGMKTEEKKSWRFWMGLSQGTAKKALVPGKHPDKKKALALSVV